MFSAGRVLLMPKGAYNPLTTYEMLDIVSYNGSSYIAKGTTTGNLPTDTTYWQLSAYGGQAANIAGNFAELESSSVATAIHYVDDIFVDENSQLMKATQTINIGDTIDANVNCAPTTVEALIAYLSSYVDSLDSLNKKIQGAIEIAVQTDLHSLAIGEYYKKQTTFYVTNAPTGINQEASATFRLTVEAALDNASQASSPLLLTLRTPDGVVYTQGFDGTNWGSWVEVASAASVSALNTAKQPKTLDTPITVGGVQQTTVEGALGSINKELTENNNDLNTKMSYINPIHVTMNVYMTSDAIPSWGNFTTQDATDIAQAMYDVYKKIGGKQGNYFGGITLMWYKKSDGTFLASENDLCEIIMSGANYNTCLADNSKTRMRFSLKPYGYCVTTDFALWGSSFNYLRQGTDTSGAVIDYHEKQTAGTISTYVG